MKVLPLRADQERFLKRRNLLRKYEKQKKLLEENIFHPSLNFELLEPKHMHIYSFRIDRKYRAVFIFVQSELIEIVDINNHYQ
ncbi:MAG: plasmid stabilization protein [bacterium]|nr:plasmid stabilization protein [bacterium]